MANFTISPNMNLVIPTPGEDPGPDYATNLANSLSIIDGHNHTSGYGLQINPAGMNINADLPMNGNNLTLVKTVNFSAQVASLAGTAPNLGCLYVGGSELYYNDEAGNVVQITNTGNVNAGAGSITGLPSGTASATYSAGTFVFQSATNTAANIDGESFVLRNSGVSSKGLTLSPPNSMAADYSLVLPTTPASTKFMTLDSSGNMGASVAYPLTGGDMASATITGAKIAAGTVTLANQVAPNIVKSSSSGTFNGTPTFLVAVTNLANTITTSGNPVTISFQSDGTAGTAQIGVFAGPGAEAFFYIFRGVTQISQVSVQSDGTSIFFVPPAVLNFVDTPAAGTYTYTLKVYSTDTASVIKTVMVTREF